MLKRNRGEWYRGAVDLIVIAVSVAVALLLAALPAHAIGPDPAAPGCADSTAGTTWAPENATRLAAQLLQEPQPQVFQATLNLVAPGTCPAVGAQVEIREFAADGHFYGASFLSDSDCSGVTWFFIKDRFYDWRVRPDDGVSPWSGWSCFVYSVSMNSCDRADVRGGDRIIGTPDIIGVSAEFGNYCPARPCETSTDPNLDCTGISPP